MNLYTKIVGSGSWMLRKRNEFYEEIERLSIIEKLRNLLKLISENKNSWKFTKFLELIEKLELSEGKKLKI
jgi:hypothetical protein